MRKPNKFLKINQENGESKRQYKKYHDIFNLFLENENENDQSVVSSKSKSKKLLDLPENPGNLEEYISILRSFQKECEVNCRYIEAGLAENKIKETKKEIEKQKKQNYKSKQSEQKNQVEAKINEDFTDFNAKWDAKMKEYEEEARKLEEVMINKHMEAYEKMKESLEQSMPQKPKDSAELLNLRKREEHLVKQKLYNEANNVKMDRIALEEKEKTQWEKDRKKKIMMQLNNLQKKQEAELKALQKKIIVGQEQQRKERGIDLDKFIQKGENTKKSLEIQHATNLLKLDKQLKSNGSNGSQIITDN